MRRLRNYGLKTRHLSAQRGINSRLDELQAAILEAKLPHLADWVERRRSIAARYSQALRGSTWLQAPVEADGNHHAFHLYVIRADGRDAFRAALRDDGIETEVHYPVPIHRQPAFAELAIPPDGLPVSEAASERVVSVPVFPELSDDEVAQVAASLTRIAPAPPD